MFSLVSSGLSSLGRDLMVSPLLMLPRSQLSITEGAAFSLSSITSDVCFSECQRGSVAYGEGRGLNGDCSNSNLVF